MAKAQKTLSRRVLVKVNRGLTDVTPVVVWEHEIPLLEAVHGEGTVTVVEDAAAALDDKFAPKRGDLMKRPPSQAIGLQDVFCGDPRAEYERLAAVYGAHPEMKISVVEYVYGRYDQGRFAMMVQPADLEDLSERQLRERLAVEEISAAATASRADLIKQLTALA